MPKVGDKHFPYTKAGYAAAAKAKKGRGYNEGGVAELTEEDKEELRKLTAAQNKKNRETAAKAEENKRKVDRGNWEGKVEGEVENFRRGGLARSRRNHKGCGCVMEGRRKKTLHT